MRLTISMSRLACNDFRLVGRDRFLVYLFLYINLIAVGLRFALPYLNAALAEGDVAPFVLSEWYPLLVAYFLIFLGAALIGMIYGFVLIEEKDNNTITALLVSPLPLNHYLFYRAGVPTVVAFFQVIVAVLITGVAVPPLWQLALVSLGAALTAPIVALYFAVFAENKVQGLALAKFIGAAGFVIPVAWFTLEPLQLLFGLFPPFWVSKAYWLAQDGNPLWVGALALGVVLQLVLIAILAGRFRDAAYGRS